MEVDSLQTSNMVNLQEYNMASLPESKLMSLLDIPGEIQNEILSYLLPQGAIAELFIPKVIKEDDSGFVSSDKATIQTITFLNQSLRIYEGKTAARNLNETTSLSLCRKYRHRSTWLL